MNEFESSRLTIRSTDDGLHLEGSILWFDSQKNGDLSFLSSAAFPTRQQGPQLIATEETIKILEVSKKKPRALVCQYNRPFSIGKLKMELLPSGGILGGASLHVEFNNKRILYAPNLQTQKVSTVRQMQLKKAHTLILNASHPNPGMQGPNRKKEIDRLLEVIQSYVAANIYPVVLCQPVATAQELTKLFCSNDIPLAVHGQIYRINQVYEDYGSLLGAYSVYSPKHHKKKVLLFPLSDASKRHPALPEGRPVLTVEDVFSEQDLEAQREEKDRFYISSTCDGKELREIIAAVMPKEVYIFGPYTKRYVEDLKNCGVKVKALYPNDQPLLF